MTRAERLQRKSNVVPTTYIQIVMKVIILNGSPKAKGNTSRALREVERTLQNQGIETEWIHVGHLDIRGCMACNRCWDTGVCGFNDIVNEISLKMKEADGLLIG